jgi:soluble lytic murein transglycosylase-like protein
MAQKRISKKEQERLAALAARRRRLVGYVMLVVVGVALVLAEAISLSGLNLGLPFGIGKANSQSITNPQAPLASFYTPEVQRWRPEIQRWARDYGINPNVIAIVIQIESCGNPVVLSGAGAVGLMQVMPFHFGNGQNMFNPDTNVQRGMSVFYECLTQFSGWDLGLALACYNGGPGVTQQDFRNWAPETQSYYHWATGLWNDVVKGHKTSKVLSEWLAAGGQGLCERAALAQSSTALETSPNAGAPTQP